MADKKISELTDAGSLPDTAEIPIANAGITNKVKANQFRGQPGLDGAPGPVGATGPTGPGGGATGPTGATGPPGLDGVQGNPGATGAGVTGATGTQGPTGTTGATGLQGATGVGSTGATGPIGTDGIDGARGPQGVPGNDGIDGLQGAAGFTGATGPVGATGSPAGATGATGIAGTDGLDGSAGATGATGAAVVDPIQDQFGTPDTAFEFDTSSFSGLTALSPTPDAEDADTTVPDHYYLRDDGSGWVGRYATPPSTPYTVVAKLSDHSLDADNGIVGMFIGQGTPGIMDFVYLVAANRQLKTARWTNPTTYSGDINAWTLFYSTPPAYFAILVNSSSDVDFLFSMGGRIWIKVTDARNPSITIGSVGIAMNANSAGVMGSAFDYMRIWNSAKTFPGVP